MNKEKLIELADKIETLHHASDPNHNGVEQPAFHMADTMFKCGAPACILGWMRHLSNIHHDDCAVARHYNLTEHQLYAIAFPKLTIYYNDVTPKMAADMLRGFVDGKPIWDGLAVPERD